MNQAVIAQNKQAVRRFFEVINEGKLELLRQFMADDVIDHNKIIYGEADEPGAAFDGIRQQLAALHPLHMQVEELVAEDVRVVARITQSGVHSGPHPRMPEPTHRSFRNESMLLFTLEAGKIKEIRGVSDRLGLFLQLGWDWPTVD